MTKQALTVKSQDAMMETEAQDLMGAFLAGRSERTRQAYSQDLEAFRAFIGAKDIDDAAGLLMARGHGKANAIALAYRNVMIEAELSSATINRRLASLRSLVKLARTLGIVPWTLEVSNMKAEAYRDTTGPGRKGVKGMLDALDRRLDDKAARDRAMVRLLHDLALRRGEVVGLDLEDVDLEAGRVSVQRKGKRQTTKLTLPEPTRTALWEWISIRGIEPGPLFTNFDRAGKGKRLSGTSLYRIVRDLGAKVGIKTRPHGLRHTAITEACKRASKAGIALEEVRDFSGHADVRTLMIYRDRERNVQGQLAALVADGV